MSDQNKIAPLAFSKKININGNTFKLNVDQKDAIIVERHFSRYSARDSAIRKFACSEEAAVASPGYSFNKILSKVYFEEVRQPMCLRSKLFALCRISIQKKRIF